MTDITYKHTGNRNKITGAFVFNTVGYSEWFDSCGGLVIPYPREWQSAFA